MALSSSSSISSKGIVVTIPVLVLSASLAAIFFFFLLSSLSSCTCGGGRVAVASVPSPSGGDVAPTRVIVSDGGETIRSSREDVEWVKDQIRVNGLHMQDNVLRKGINPRTRAQQHEDLLQYKGISHYEGPESVNHTALPCPGELLTEEHHSNYGEPWAGGRDVFEFLAESSHLKPDSNVLEIGCGTLRVGLHFIRYLHPGHYHCLERDELSLMAAFRYELPSQGLLHKRPLIVKGFADEMKTARRVGAFKQYIVGRSSEATFADAFEKQEAIIRYLGGFDSTGENLQTTQKQEAAKHCKCTIADVENALAKFTWAREAHNKMEKLKAEGKPIPTNIGEVQKLMGSTPFDLAQSSLAKSGQISRNALCPCGSKKRYKRCCGKDK